MKIGIITFHCAENYGAMLQSYALKMFLKTNLDAEVEIIDYRTANHIDSYKKLRINSNIKASIISIINFLKFRKSDKLREQRFGDFLMSYIASGERIDDYKKLASYHSNFNAIITGSDQVFGTYRNSTNPYYLDFFQSKSTKKIAYSASFGFSSFDGKYKSKVIDLLQSFNAISMREDTGTKLIEELSGKKVLTTIDPSLLISKEEWINNFKLKSYNKDKYILCYSLVGSKEQIEIAKKVQDKLGYKIKVISKRFNTSYKDIEVINEAGPYEFLEAFNNASYIVTDSFHGTCFSIIFEKDFNSFIKIEKKADRIFTLLRKVSLMDRVVTKEGIMNIITDKINYSDFTPLIDKERVNALTYLQQAILGR